MMTPVPRKSVRGMGSNWVASRLRGQYWPLECQGQIGGVELKGEKRLQVPFGDLGAVGEVVMGYECMSYEGASKAVSALIRRQPPQAPPWKGGDWACDYFLVECLVRAEVMVGRVAQHSRKRK